jgi:fluoroacetyl-CoA thioesterase
MNGGLKLGAVSERRFVVERGHAIDFADGGMPAVLSTPWLIWFLEHAAREAVLPFLSPGESTVGTHVEVRHTAATPVGQAVTCRARVLLAEGMTVSFQLEAHDSQERIARGLHKLQVIRVDRFAQRVGRKSGPAG